jgi:hypothetical protein
MAQKYWWSSSGGWVAAEVWALGSYETIRLDLLPYALETTLL